MFGYVIPALKHPQAQQNVVNIRDDFARGSKLLLHGCNGVVEWICLYLPAIHSIIINVYRPPSCEESLFYDTPSKISCVIDTAGAPMPTVMMCGDFNLPFVNWSTGSLSGGTLNVQRQAEALIDFMSEYCLH